MAGSGLGPIEMRRAAAILWAAWQDGRHLPGLPEDCRPRSSAEGYRIQVALAQLSGAPPVGWKIAATSAAGQAHIGVDGPLAGRLLAGRVKADGAAVPIGAGIMRVAELEFAFRMGRDLPYRRVDYEQSEVMDAVGSLHPAIELPDSRYADYAKAGAPQLIADNACAHYCVVGAAAPESWRALDLARHRATATLNGRPAGEGSGANVLGDPRIALTWLVNELRRREVRFAAGQLVITGTCLKPIPVVPGDRVAGDFGELGTIAVALTDGIN